MKPIAVHMVRQLLVDDDIIEEQVGATRVVHEWEKDEGNPVFVKELPGEGYGPVAGVVTYDPADGKFRMWYGVYDEAGTYPAGYAESGDGLAWRRHPHMAPEGSRGAVVIAPRGLSGDRRFLSAAYLRPQGDLPGRVGLYASCDGMTWEPLEGRPCWEGPSDVIDLMWDSKRERFVSYHKIWRVTGTATDGASVRAYFATYDVIAPAEGVTRIVGRTVLPEIREATYDLVCTSKGQDDGGGGVVTDEIAMLRVIGRAESKDFLHWTDHAIVFEPDGEEAADVQYYGMPVFEYEGMVLALPRYFEGISGRMDVQFASSRDGVDFTMPDKKLVLSCGPEGSWDGGMVICAPRPLEVDGRLCIYYGAYSTNHTYLGSDLKAATGRAWLRKDGFASMTGGLLRTRPLRLMGNALFINATGRLTIKALGMDGMVVARCTWQGDSTEGVVVWQAGGVHGEPVRLQFDLSQGHLYSFWSESLETGEPELPR